MCNGVTIILPNTSKGNPFHIPIPLGSIKSNKDGEPTLSMIDMLANIQHVLITIMHFLMMPQQCIRFWSPLYPWNQMLRKWMKPLKCAPFGWNMWKWINMSIFGWKLTISSTCGSIIPIAPMICHRPNYLEHMKKLRMIRTLVKTPWVQIFALDHLDRSISLY